MGKRHIKSAIQAITGGYMPPDEVMSLARRFRDIPIFPEKPKEWDKIPAKKHKALKRAKQRHEKVLIYRRRLAVGSTRKDAAALLLQAEHRVALHLPRTGQAVLAHS